MPHSQEIVVYDRAIDMPEEEQNTGISHQNTRKTGIAYHAFEPSTNAGWTAAFMCVSAPLFVRSVANLGELSWDPVNVPVQLIQSGAWAMGGFVAFAFAFIHKSGDAFDDKHYTFYRQWPHHKADYDADVKEDQANFHAMREKIQTFRDDPNLWMSSADEMGLASDKRIDTQRLNEEMRLAKKYCAVNRLKKKAIMAGTGSLTAAFSAATLYYGYNAVSNFSALLNGDFNMEDGFANGDKFLPGAVSAVAATVLTPFAYWAGTSFANHAQRPVINKKTGMLAPQIEPGV